MTENNPYSHSDKTSPTIQNVTTVFFKFSKLKTWHRRACPVLIYCPPVLRKVFRNDSCLSSPSSRKVMGTLHEVWDNTRLIPSTKCSKEYVNSLIKNMTLYDALPRNPSDFTISFIFALPIWFQLTRWAYNKSFCYFWTK